MSQRRAKREAREAAAESRPPRPVSVKVGFALAAAVVAGAIAAAVVLTRDGGSSSAGSVVSGSSVPTTQGGQPLTLAGIDPVTGKPVSLASFKGKPIVLNVWASWCTGCVAEAGALAKFERAHPEAQVIGLDIQDSISGARAFYRRVGWRHPSIFDPSGALAARLGLQGLPTTFFLDRRHRIVARIVGETDLAGFTAGLRKAST